MSTPHLKSIDISTTYLNGLRAALDTFSAIDIAIFMDYISEAFDQGHQIFIAGNGGSASTASHMACDLQKTVLGKTYQAKAKRIKVIALTNNMEIITAWGNDVSYDVIFAEQLRSLATSQDLLIVLSASGNSPNILEAIRAAKDIGMHAIGMLGANGGKAKSILDHAIVVQSKHYGHIEDGHMILNHMITEYFKTWLEWETNENTKGYPHNGGF